MDNMRNNKTILQAAIFVLLFLAILVPVSYMVRTNGDVKDRFAGFYAEKKDSLDVVMIGSSPVFPYYAAPKLWGETGIAMYPLSTNVQRPAAMRYLAEEAERRKVRFILRAPKGCRISGELRQFIKEHRWTKLERFER